MGGDRDGISLTQSTPLHTPWTDGEMDERSLDESGVGFKHAHPDWFKTVEELDPGKQYSKKGLKPL